MKYKKKNKHARSYGDIIIQSIPATLTIGVLAILFGLVFSLLQGIHKPIERADAIAYNGTFLKYEESRKYRVITFEDDSSYDIYPYTNLQNIDSKMDSLSIGTKLDLLVNPRNGYVIEIKAQDEELLNSNKTQTVIQSYCKGYLTIGIITCLIGVSLTVYAVVQNHYKQKDKKHQSQKIQS